MTLLEKNQARIQKIKEKLAAIEPTILIITDESHQHIGHVGAKSGAGHFKVEIQAKALDELTKIQQHQKIYQLLASMIGPDIHALKIKVLSTSNADLNA